MLGLFRKIGGIFSKLFGAAPSLAQKINTTIKFLAPIAMGIIAIVDPALEPEASGIMKEVQTDFALVNGLIQQNGLKGSNKQVIAGTLQSITDNLNGILSAGHIKNPDTVAKVTGMVGIINGEIQAILPELGVTPPTVLSTP